MIKGDLYGDGLNNMKQELASLVAIAHETTKCIEIPTVRIEPKTSRRIPFTTIIDIAKTLENIGSDIQMVKKSDTYLTRYKWPENFTMEQAKEAIVREKNVYLMTRTLWHAQAWAKTPIWYRFLDHCVLEESLQKRVDQIVDRLGDFIAVHARVELDWEKFCRTRAGYSLEEHFRTPEQIATFVHRHPLTKQSRLKTILILTGDSDYDVKTPFVKKGYRVYLRNDLERGRNGCYTAESAIDFELAKAGRIFFGNSESTFSQNIRRLNPKSAYYNTRMREVNEIKPRFVPTIKLYTKRPSR